MLSSTGPRPTRPVPATQPLREGRAAGSSLAGLSAPPALSRGHTSGGVRERPNRHDWKSCVGKLTVGSNPTASATWALTRIIAGRARNWPSNRPRNWPIEEAMGLALEEAALAVSHGDVPVGAVALFDGRVIASRHNEREKLGDPTAHAEMLALSDAAAVIGTWRLSEVTLVVTLEPCPMCAGGLVAGPGGPPGLRRR